MLCYKTKVLCYFCCITILSQLLIMPTYTCGHWQAVSRLCSVLSLLSLLHCWLLCEDGSGTSLKSVLSLTMKWHCYDDDNDDDVFNHCSLTESDLFSTYVLYWHWQNSASKLLLAIMESRHDSENADRILVSIQKFQLLVCLISCFTFTQLLCIIIKLSFSFQSLAH